jgi:mannose-6-phosphate isomerase-like protein (cupin superfamily)
MWIRWRIPAAVGLFLLPLLFATAAAQGDDKPIIQNAAPGKFQKIPNLPDCVTAAVEQGDPTKGASGCRVPWHFHTPNEQLMMISGVGRVETKGEQAVNLRAGGFAYAPVKHVHQFTCVGGPCSFFLHSDAPFDIHYVDQSGNEMSTEQALSTRHKT